MLILLLYKNASSLKVFITSLFCSKINLTLFQFFVFILNGYVLLLALFIYLILLICFYFRFLTPQKWWKNTDPLSVVKKHGPPESALPAPSNTQVRSIFGASLFFKIKKFLKTHPNVTSTVVSFLVASVPSPWSLGWITTLLCSHTSVDPYIGKLWFTSFGNKKLTSLFWLSYYYSLCTPPVPSMSFF